MKRTKYLLYSSPSVGEEEIEAVVKVLRSGWLTTGPKTAEFEALIAEYVGAERAVCLNSCTAGLHLSLLALNIGEGDEVITTPYTFASTGNVIIQTLAKPVFVDVDRLNYNINPYLIEKAITKKTKAIIPVHFAGHPCDMTEIRGIAQKYNLYIIEDAAHAIGAEYKRDKIGKFGKSVCFSFYATKNVTTGEGGAIVTDDNNLADRFKILRLHGIGIDAWKRYSAKESWYYEIGEHGWKYNMSDIQAALGIVQLKKLDSFTDIRRKYAKIYTQELGRVDGIVVPYEHPNVKHAYHIYPILLKRSNRDKFIDRMHELNIGCSVHFVPLHLHPFYQKTLGCKTGDFPIAEYVYAHEVSLPLYPKMTEEDIYDVISAVKLSI
jgi:dTDP-4-amino-4,6-dideoxygalactose transaminase